MATFLYKLGRFMFRRRWYVISAWIAILIAIGVASATAASPPPDKFSMPGTESQRAFDLMDHRFPGANADGASAKLVFKAPNNEKLTSDSNRAKVAKVLTALKGNQVGNVSDPFVPRSISKNETTAYTTVTYKVSGSELSKATKDAAKRAAQVGRDSGLTVETSGDVVQSGSAPSGEAIGVAIAAVVLVITFGSLIAAGLPLFTALIGVGISTSVVGALAATLGLSDTTSILGTMIGLAVGIDYALFITSRYRAELIAGRERVEAAGRAVGTAGSAVVFAGLTVVVALSGLAVVNVPLLTRMGLVAAGAVVVAVLIALTLIPALLGIVGKRIFGRRVRKRNPETGVPAASSDDKPNMGTRWSRFVLRHRVALLLAGVVFLGALASPVLGMKLGMPSDGTAPKNSTQRKAYDMLSDGFGPGFNGPLLLVLDTDGSRNPQAAAKTVITEISHVHGVVNVSPAVFNPAGNTAMITVTPANGPSDSKTEDLVNAIRARANGLTHKTGASRLLVTGATAANIDFSKRMSDSLIPYLSLVVGLAFVLLMIVFRSVLVPLKAALGFLLSLLASLGAVVAVFQWGWLDSLLGISGTGPIMSMMPIFLIGIVFGLAMDYEVFLVTRIREGYVHGESPKQAVVTGFQHGTRVVTAAALIMIGVFSAFISGGQDMIKMIGLGLASAVAFDAFVVRMTIVPALLGLLGRSAWWLPRWLNAILPNVDVEGETLQRKLAAAEAAPKQEEAPVAVGPAQIQPLSPRPAEAPLVRGRVVRGNGVAVPGTRITLTTPDGRQVGRAVSAEDGSFGMYVPKVGQYLMIAQFVGHRPQARNITVTAGTNPQDLVLVGVGGIGGLVTTGPSNMPVGDATVVLTDGQGTVVHARAVDERGQFAFYNLAPGDYTLTAAAPNFHSNSLTARAPASGLGRHDIQLAGNSSIRGIARDQNRTPLAGAQVALVDSYGSVVASSVTNDRGEYTLSDIPSGNYSVVAQGYPPAKVGISLVSGTRTRQDVVLSHHKPPVQPNNPLVKD